MNRDAPIRRQSRRARHRGRTPDAHDAHHNLVFEGYRVTAVETGEAALSEIERRTDALVLVDVMLPG